jgi:mono/diheme cytochrome c family protein
MFYVIRLYGTSFVFVNNVRVIIVRDSVDKLDLIGGNMTLNKVKLFAIAIIALPLFALAIFNAAPAGAVSSIATDDDVAAQYKKQCLMCHKANAEKFFEPSKMDEALVEIVLKGKKAEKPPNMPGYEEKGMTKDQAKLLVAYMRQVRTPSQ